MSPSDGIIALFDLLLVGLFGYSVVHTVVALFKGILPTSATDELALAAVGLDGLIFLSSACAFLSLFARSRHVAIYHRAIVIALLIRMGFIAADAQLPSDSGSGLFLIGVGLFLVPLMLIALRIAVYLHKT